MPTVAQSADRELAEPPFDPAVVEEMLRQLVKASRAHQLYLRNNPMHARAVDQARAAFAPLWAEAESVVLAVAETELTWEGATVLSEPEKASEGLAWLLYKDGVRELQLARGFEEELIAFLDIIQRVRRALPDEDDLLTLLWEQDFACLRYRYVDLTAEDVAPMDGQRGPERASEAHAADDAPEEDPPPAPSGVVNIEEFDSTLYFLDEREVAYLHDGVVREYAGDLRRNVLAILFDIFEAQTDDAVRAEICGILESLMLHLLSAGELRAVAYLLAEADIAAGRAREVSEEHRRRLAGIADRLSEGQALSQLLQSLDESGDAVPRDDLHALLAQLRPTALGTLLAWIGRVESARIRSFLEEAVARLAASNTAELVRLIGAADALVAREAVRRAGVLRSPAAVPPLGRALTDGDAAMRLAAAQALGEIGSAGALQALERAVGDGDRDVRVAVARAIAARGYRPALPRVEAVVRGKALREADLTERVAFFEAYGALCGDAGVPLLDGLLNGKGFLGRREEPELRACAAMALGHVRTAAARASLTIASGDKEALVRNAVSRAMGRTGA